MIMSSFINQILALSIVFAVGILSFWVLLSGRRKKMNQVFFAWSIFFLLGILFGYLANVTEDAGTALIFMRIRFGAVPLFLIFAYFFSIFIYEKQKSHYLLNFFVIGVGGFLSVLSIFTGYIVYDLVPVSWGMEIIFGTMASLFYGTLAILTLIIAALLIKGYSVSSEKNKLKVQYFLVGAIPFIIANLVFNIFFPLLGGTYQYFRLGDYSALPLFSFIAYAIVKKGLFDIKVALTFLLVGGIGILLFTQIIIAPTTIWRILGIIALVFFSFFSYLLIRATSREVKQKEILEVKVRERTEELEKSKEATENAYREMKKEKEKLEKLYRLTTGRELRMAELKKKIKDLEKKTEENGEKEEW